MYFFIFLLIFYDLSDYFLNVEITLNVKITILPTLYNYLNLILVANLLTYSYVVNIIAVITGVYQMNMITY